MAMPIARCCQGRNYRLHAALWQHDDRNYIDYIQSCTLLGKRYGDQSIEYSYHRAPTKFPEDVGLKVHKTLTGESTEKLGEKCF